MICTNCGNEIKDENTFCTNCGMKTEKDSTKEMKDNIKVLNYNKLINIVVIVILLSIIAFSFYKISKIVFFNSDIDNPNTEQKVNTQEKKYMSVQDVYDDFKKQNLQKDVSFIEVRKYKDDLIILVFGVIPNTDCLDEIGFITVQENSYIYSRKELWCYGYTDELELAYEAVNLEENKRVSEIWNNQDIQYETLSNIETPLYIDYFKNEKGTIENIKRQTSNNFTDKILYDNGFSEETVTDNLNNTNTVNSSVKQSNNANENINISSNNQKTSKDIPNYKIENSNNNNTNMQQKEPPRSEQELAKEQIEYIQIWINPYGDESSGYKFYEKSQNCDLNFVVSLLERGVKKQVSFAIVFDGLTKEYFEEDSNGIFKEYMQELGYNIQITHSETGQSQTITPSTDKVYTEYFDVVNGSNTFNIVITDKYNNSKTISNSFIMNNV